MRIDGAQYGERLLTLAEREAREAGAERLFVLTTQRGALVQGARLRRGRPLDSAGKRQALYNFQRRSRVLVRAL